LLTRKNTEGERTKIKIATDRRKITSRKGRLLGNGVVIEIKKPEENLRVLIVRLYFVSLFREG